MYSGLIHSDGYGDLVTIVVEKGYFSVSENTRRSLYGSSGLLLIFSGRHYCPLTHHSSACRVLYWFWSLLTNFNLLDITFLGGFTGNLFLIEVGVASKVHKLVTFSLELSDLGRLLLGTISERFATPTERPVSAFQYERFDSVLWSGTYRVLPLRWENSCSKSSVVFKDLLRV